MTLTFAHKNIAVCLQLSDTSLEDFDRHDLSMRRVSARSDNFRSSVEANSLRFSLQDGRVADVCASEDDDVWVVNFKRGIVSALQNTMTSLTSEATVLEVAIINTWTKSLNIFTLIFCASADGRNGHLRHGL